MAVQDVARHFYKVMGPYNIAVAMLFFHKEEHNGRT